MAQNDFIVRLLAQDNLSPTLKNVQNALKDTGVKSAYLDDIRKQFERITSSAAPAKRQLRDLQTIMANMNLRGLDNTALFTEMAEEAGRLRDALGDARQATAAFANDNFKLEAMTQGVQLVSAGFSTYTSIMHLVGTENKEVANAILKVQAALSIANGVQSIANALNKDSALMHRLKQIRMLASAAATGTETAATGANTAGVVANNIARKAWNVTAAIGKAIMGDYTGLILVGAAALGAYALATHKSKDELEAQAAATGKANDANAEYSERLAESTGTLVGKFMNLKAQWDKLKTTAEKIQFLKDTKTEMESLGLKVNDLKTAEDIFVNNTGNVVRALEQRAKAAALQEQMVDAYKDYYKELDRIEGMANNAKEFKFNGTREFSSVSLPKALEELREGTDYTVKDLGYTKQYKITDAGVKSIEDRVNRQRRSLTEDGKAVLSSFADKRLEKRTGQIAARMKANDKEMEQNPASQFFTDKTDPSATKTPRGTQTKDRVPEIGSIKYYQDQLSELNRELNETNVSGVRLQKINEEKAVLEDTIKLLKERYGLEKSGKESAEAGSITDLKNRLQEVDKELRDTSPTEKRRAVLLKLKKDYEQTIKVKEILNGQKEAPKPVSSIGGVTLTGADPAEDKRVSLAQARSLAEQAKTDLLDGIIDSDTAKKIIVNLNEQLAAIGLKPLDLRVNVDTKRIETGAETLARKKEEFKEMTDTIGQMGASFSGLGNAIGGAAGEWMGFTGQAIQSIAQLLPQIMTLITARQAETMAGAMSSASGIGFPQNLAAIAASVAAVTALFASLPKFAEGGIIGGASMAGDRLLIRANAGEMVLTRQQQGNLWRLLEGGGNGSGLPHVITLKAKGSDLVATIGNYNDKMRRQG